jgi:branched-chain amino acid transport system permease protein
VQDSITLLAVVLIGGIYSFWGAVVAGVLLKLMPAVLENFGLPADLLLIVFGVGVLQAVLTTPEGLSVKIPRDVTAFSRTLRERTRRAP